MDQRQSSKQLEGVHAVVVDPTRIRFRFLDRYAWDPPQAGQEVAPET